MCKANAFNNSEAELSARVLGDLSFAVKAGFDKQGGDELGNNIIGGFGGNMVVKDELGIVGYNLLGHVNKGCVSFDTNLAVRVFNLHTMKWAEFLGT